MTTSRAMPSVALDLEHGGVGAVLDAVAESTRTAVGADRVTIYTVQGERVASVHTTEHEPEIRPFILAAAGKGPDEMPIWQFMLGAPEPLLVVEDLQRMDSALADLAERVGRGAFVGARFEHRFPGEDATLLMGAMFCRFDEARAFSPDERNALAGLAGLATLALANAHLYAITTRDLVQAEERAAAEHAFRLLADNAREMIVRCRPSGEIIYASYASERLVGRASEDLVGASIHEVLGFDFGERLVPDGEAQTTLAPHATEDPRWIETSARSLWRDGEITEIHAVSRDVSDRRRAEQVLRTAAAEQTALRDVAVAVAKGGVGDDVFQLVAERASVVVGARQSAVVRLDDSSNAIIAGAWSAPDEDAIPVGDLRPLVRHGAIGRCVASGTPTRTDGESDVLAVEGRIGVAAPVNVGGAAWGAVGAVLPSDAPDEGQEERLGRFADLLALALDAAQGRMERAQLETELRQSQKLEAVGQLAAGVAHEINTPIQFVSDSVHFLDEAFADLRELLTAARRAAERATAGEEGAIAELDALEEEIELDFLDEQVPKAVERIRDGTQRVAEIVRAMREFSHPQGGEQSEADLNRAIRTTLTVARNELKYVAEVEADFGDLPPITCHLGDVNQVVLNLLVNAAHAIADRVGDSGERGTISIRTALDGDEAVIEIGDTGSGIPVEARERVFDPFFTTKDVGKGTGQGLAIARKLIVDNHGGDISFDTEIGVGTTFRIRLPVDGVEESS